jgi:hypothetical protein
MSDLEKIDFVDFFTIGERVYWAVVPEGGDCGGKTLEQMKRWLGEANVYGPFESDDAAQADADKVVGEDRVGDQGCESYGVGAGTTPEFHQ